MSKLQVHFLESAEILKKVGQQCTKDINSAAIIMAETFKNGGKVLLCGNGGSAADCQHMATEFVSRLTKEFDRPGLPAMALTTDTSFLTAFTNDCGYEDVFVRQVHVFGKPGDILLGISTSGTSPNIIRALQAAKEKKMKTILLSSISNPPPVFSDITIAVPTTNTQYIQESHLAIEHTICELVEKILFVEGDGNIRI